MTTLIGVRLQHAGRLIYCDSGDLEITHKDKVIIQTKDGCNVAWVVIAPGQIVYSEVEGQLVQVLRKATLNDIESMKQDSN
jgi:cell fate regulator YaaT (PSP1 superfamily)